MSDASEVKRAIYMSTDVSHRKNYDMVVELVKKLFPNGEIKVTTPELQELERIVAELKAELLRVELVADAAVELIKEKYSTIVRQTKVIEKLKGMVSHYETCATVDRYDDEEVPCDCGLEKELEAIEQGEGT